MSHRRTESASAVAMTEMCFLTKPSDGGVGSEFDYEFSVCVKFCVAV